MLIAVAFWDCPRVKTFSWSTPPISDALAAPNQQPGLLPDGSVLAEIVTWRPPWEVKAGAKGEPDQSAAVWATDREREGTTLTRSLAFVWAGDSPTKRLSLVAGTAGGAVAVAGWRMRGGSEEEGRGQENDGGSGWTGEGWLGEDRGAGKLETSASFQIGHGPTQLEVFSCEGGQENEREIGGEGCHGFSTGGERVFVNGGRNAVLRCRRPDKERFRTKGRDMWRCMQVRPAETKLKWPNGGCFSVRRLQAQTP